MGVAVQLMVDAHVSGVMFTCNPVSGDPSIVAVNASWGLGSAVVGGEVTPDEYLVSKVTGEVVRRTVNRKEIEHRPDEGGGTVTLPVPADRAEAACLDEERLAALVAVARTVQDHFGAHQDIEWALDGAGDVYVVQSRPVTAAPKAEGPKGMSAMDLIMSKFGAR
jgi:pyruvate,water dikinase